MAVEFDKPIWAAVPVKAFNQAKTRLSPALPATIREGLARAMLADVLGALMAARQIHKTFVVTADPEVAAFAQSHGALTLKDRRCAGQTAAVEQAAEEFQSRGCEAMLTLPGDLPLLCPDDVNAICGLLSNAKPLVLAAAGNDGGTNALLCAPPMSMKFHFGENSFAKHLKAARELGLNFTLSDAPGFRLDLDRPDDLEEFMSRKSATHVYSFMRALMPEYQSGGFVG